MKKLICVALAVLLFLPVLASAAELPVAVRGREFDVATSCNHIWRQMKGVAEEGWYPIAETMHEYRQYHVNVCDKCDQIC